MQSFIKKIKSILIIFSIITIYWIFIPNTTFKSLTIFLVFLLAWFEQRNVNLKNIELELENLPSSFEGYKIAFASDIHSDFFNKYYFANKTVEVLKNQDYDICLLGGDYISNHKYAQETFRIFKDLKHVYAVLGNHDMPVPIAKWKEFAKTSDINLLINDTVSITKDTDQIRLTGISEKKIAKNIYLKENEFNVVLSHQPDKILELPTKNINLFLCGHTHAGQITFFKKYSPYLPTVMKKKFQYGKTIYNSAQMYITSGVGTTFLPFRLFARAEIVIITLKAKS